MISLLELKTLDFTHLREHRSYDFPVIYTKKYILHYLDPHFFNQMSTVYTKNIYSSLINIT